MSQLLYGAPIAEKLLLATRELILKESLTPGLAVIMIGENEASQRYIKLKEEAAKKLGIDVSVYRFNERADAKEIINTIAYLNTDPDIHGVIVQLPLPQGYDADEIVNTIDPAKDVDGFTARNREKIKSGASAILPPLARGIQLLLGETKEPIEGKTAALLSKNDVFSDPLASLLIQWGSKVAVVSPQDPSLAEKTKKADIVITAIGEAHCVTPDMIKPGATIIDIGIAKVNGVTTGDVDPAVDALCAFRSPVPGGIGPLTVAGLLFNVAESARQMKEGDKE